MYKTYNYCNNCGEAGHLFHQCKKPITSIGIIAYRENKAGIREYLLIRRKDSLGYIEFMRGKYSIGNKIYIENLLSEMTKYEHRRLLEEDFDTLWSNLWGENVGIQYRGEEKVSREKFKSLRKGILIGNNEYSLKSLIENVTTNWEEPEWGFPKGRRNYQEKALSCALRECEEETGYRRSSFKVIQNIIPLEEVFTGSNFKSYKHCYYLAQYMPPLNINNISEKYQTNEVSAVSWMSLEDALNSIRSYNVEKKDIITQVDKILNTYTIY